MGTARYVNAPPAMSGVLHEETVVLGLIDYRSAEHAWIAKAIERASAPQDADVVYTVEADEQTATGLIRVYAPK